jgi:hypothetical protein
MIPMTIEQLTENRAMEIDDLNTFLSYVVVLNENVGLSDNTINELQLKINIRISQCEISVLEYQNKQ